MSEWREKEVKKVTEPIEKEETKIVRWDKKRNLDKVAASLAKNPLATARELEKDLGIGSSTANRARKELAQNGTKDDRIINLTEWDFILMRAIQERKCERLLNKKERVSDHDLNNWDKEAKWRYTLFRWDVTDKEWGVINQSALDKLNELTQDS